MTLTAPHLHYLNSIYALAAQQAPHMGIDGEGEDRTGHSSCCECHMEGGGGGHCYTVCFSYIVAMIFNYYSILRILYKEIKYVVNNVFLNVFLDLSFLIFNHSGVIL